MFDLLLHSETIEHVNDPARRPMSAGASSSPTASSCSRLPSSGVEETRRRAVADGDAIRHLLEPSYHDRPTVDYLVFHEYGRDLDAVLRVSLSQADWRNQNYVFSSGKAPSSIRPLAELRP